MLRTAHDAAASLLGRLQEQTLLTSLLDGVATHGQALVLRGEPGIGKSRLLAEAAEAARDRGTAARRRHARARDPRCAGRSAPAIRGACISCSDRFAGV